MMSPATANVTAAVWGTMLGTIIGQFGVRVMNAYPKAFSREAYRTSFIAAFIAAALFGSYHLATGGLASFGELGLYVLYNTGIGALAISAIRLVADIAWTMVKDIKTAVFGFFTGLFSKKEAEEVKQSVEEDFFDEKRLRAAATMRTV